MTPNRNKRLVTDGGHINKTATVHATKVVTRDVDGDEIEMLRVPISSTRPDREGDRFAKEALDGMAEQIKTEQPNVFLNHGLAGDWMSAIPYDVDKAKVGAQMDAEVQEADDGEHDLYAYVNPDGTHEYGKKLIPKVRDEKQPEKFSVGFGIKGYEAREEVEDDYEGDGRVFTAVDEMETSNVGVPANPDASVGQAVARSGASDLPGFGLHPMAQLMHAMTDQETGFAAKSQTRVEGGCEEDGDCPDGEVCVDGECVDEESVEAAAGVPALKERIAELEAQNEPDDKGESLASDVAELREQNDELHDELESVKESLKEGRGDARTGDTTTDPMDPDLTDDKDEDGGSSESDDKDSDAATEQPNPPHEPII